jgi:hypothetical protein
MKVAVPWPLTCHCGRTHGYGISRIERNAIQFVLSNGRRENNGAVHKINIGDNMQLSRKARQWAGCAALAGLSSIAASAAATPIEMLFVGNSYTFGRGDPVMS